MLGVSLLAGVATAQDSAPAHFTQKQADRGLDLYRERCALCHGGEMNDGEFGPSLKGPAFRGKWGGQSVAALFAYTQTTMPPGQTQALGPEDYAELMAVMLAANGAAPGDKPLPHDLEALSPLTIAN